MAYLKFNLNNVLYRFICLILAIFPYNIRIYSMSILDYFVFVLLALSVFIKLKIKNVFFFIFLLVMFVLITSSFLSLLKNPEISFDFQKLIFFFKYLIIFVFPYLIIKIIDNKKKIRTLNFILFINFLLLSVWPYIYLFLISQEIITGNLRTSFPGINIEDTSAHTYSAYLCFFIVAYFLYLKNFFGHNLFFSMSLLLFSSTSLLLLGSRTGVVVITIFSIFLCVKWFLKFFSFSASEKILIKTNSIFIFFFLLIILTILLLFNNISLMDRSFYFDSILSPRLNKFFIALKEIENNYYIFGNGIFSELFWYDGVISILLAHGSFLLILLVVLFYYFLLNDLKLNHRNRKYFFIFCILFFISVFSNLITEYIMVTRYAVPVLAMLSILYVVTKNKKFDKL